MFTNRPHTRRAAIGVAVSATALLAAGCSGVVGGEADTTQLQLAAFVSPSTPYGEVIEWYIEELSERSDGQIRVEVFWEGSLVPGVDIVGGVAQGRAELGFTTPNYHPAELPLTQVMSIPFITSDVDAVQATFAELYETNSDYQAEWEHTGVVPLAIQGVSPNVLGTTEPVPDISWFRGKSLRATSLTGNVIQQTGGNAVALGLGEIYEAVQRGLVDGFTSLNLGTVPSTSLHELTPYITDTQLGIYTLTALIVNADVYESLSAGHRTVLDEVTAEFNERYTELLGAYEDGSCDTILAAGVTVERWSDATAREWTELLGDSIEQQWKSGIASSGVDADAFFDEYISLIDTHASDYESGIARCAAR